MSELVIGSGISALAYLFYHPEAFAVVGDKPGGQFLKQAELGPQYIWADDNTIHLAMELGLPTEEQTIRVGCYDGLGHVTSEPTPELRQAYSHKTRGVAQASHMSGGHGRFKALVLKPKDLVQALYDAVATRLIKGRVISIDMYSQTVTVDSPESSGKEVSIIGRSCLEYHKLISTVPAPVFLGLIGKPELAATLRARAKLYCVGFLHDLPDWVTQGFGVQNYNYIYIPDPAILYHRLTWIGEQRVGIEFTLLDARVPCEHKFMVSAIHPNGQIVGGGEVLDHLPGDVKLLGRYAQWKHEVRFNQVLQEILNG